MIRRWVLEGCAEDSIKPLDGTWMDDFLTLYGNDWVCVCVPTSVCVKGKEKKGKQRFIYYSVQNWKTKEIVQAKVEGEGTKKECADWNKESRVREDEKEKVIKIKDLYHVMQVETEEKDEITKKWWGVM